MMIPRDILLNVKILTVVQSSILITTVAATTIIIVTITIVTTAISVVCMENGFICVQYIELP